MMKRPRFAQARRAHRRESQSQPNKRRPRQTVFVYLTLVLEQIGGDKQNNCQHFLFWEWVVLCIRGRVLSLTVQVNVNFKIRWIKIDLLKSFIFSISIVWFQITDYVDSLTSTVWQVSTTHGRIVSRLQITAHYDILDFAGSPMPEMGPGESEWNSMALLNRLTIVSIHLNCAASI